VALTSVVTAAELLVAEAILLLLLLLLVCPSSYYDAPEMSDIVIAAKHAAPGLIPRL